MGEGNISHYACPTPEGTEGKTAARTNCAGILKWQKQP